MRECWEKYRNSIWAISIFVFLIHGAKLNSEIVGIDTEAIIRLPGEMYEGWTLTGRHGLVLLKKLLAVWQFQPYFAGLMTLTFFVIGVTLFAVLWNRITGDRQWGMVAGALLWISHPIITEQFYFSLQSMEICIGMIFTALALFMTMRFAEKKKWYWFVGSVALLLITFSTYQTFVPFYIFGTATVLLLESLRDVSKDENIRARMLLGRMIPYIIVFFTAFIGNILITNLCFGKTPYLEQQIFWGTVPLNENFLLIKDYIYRTYTGLADIYYHFSYGILTVLSLVLVLRKLITKRNKGAGFVLLFYLVAVLLSPYLLVFICGGGIVARAQLILPATTGFLVYIVGILLGELWKDLGISGRMLNAPKGAMAKIAVYGISACFGVALLTGVWEQTRNTLALYYTDQCRYEHDEALGRELIGRINELRGRYDYPVLVIGTKSFPENNSHIIGETMGHSFFDHDAQVEPKYYYSTRRIVGFLHTLGEDYTLPQPERVTEAYEYSKYMPEWPAQNSVQLKDGIIIVKLNVDYDE